MNPRTKVPFAAVALSVALLTACTDKVDVSVEGPDTTAPSTTAPNRVYPISWGVDCPPQTPTDIECGTIKTPRDWDTPDGPTVTVALARAKATGTKKGTVVFNPGGPGESGVASLAQQLSAYDSLRAEFDILSFDPRGIGFSDPVNCDEASIKAFPNRPPAPKTAADYKYIDDANAQLIKDCAQDMEFLGQVSTLDVAKDLDAIRAALGEQKLNYLGYSYGTKLGQIYAKNFPNNYRTMVLDGVADAAASLLDTADIQAKSSEDTFNKADAECKNNPECPVPILATLDQQLADAEAGKIKKPDGTNLSTYELQFASLSVLYQYPASALSKMLDANQKGDLSGMLDLLKQVVPSSQVVKHAINCGDGEKLTLEQVQKVEKELTPKYPHFGPFVASLARICTVWPHNNLTPKPSKIGENVNGALIIGNVNDPTTPLENAQRLAKGATNSRLVTVDRNGHLAYGRNLCATAAANTYFSTGTLPAADLTCAAEPEPQQSSGS